MSDFCLYHAITNQKSPQHHVQDTTQRSSKKNGNSFLQMSKQNLSTKTPQQFNDYTIYPQKSVSKSKKIKLDFKRVSDTDSAVSKKNKTLKSSRFQQTFDNEYFAKEQKSFRTTKSLKNRQYNLNQSQSQIKLKSCKRDNYDAKISTLQSQIDGLNKKIETCQAESKKNHFQFVILRDIVEKLRMQNLELTSKISVFDEIVKKNLKSNVQKQYMMSGFQQILMKNLQNQRKLKLQTKQATTLSQNQISADISIQNKVDDFEVDLIKVSFKKQKQSKITSQNLSNLVSQKSSKVISQKFWKESLVKPKSQIEEESEQKSKKIKPKKVAELRTQKKQTDSNVSSTIKRNKPKQILHFQNILKEKTDPKVTLEESMNEKIQKLLGIEDYGELQAQSSSSVSEQNLLESMEMIKKVSFNKIITKKPCISNSPKYQWNDSSQQDTSLTYRLTPNDSLKDNKIDSAKKQQPQNIKQVQNQLKELRSLLQSLKSKEQYINPKDTKINQIKTQKQRVLNAIKKLQNTYDLHS